jgi:hypothetical protein
MISLFFKFSIAFALSYFILTIPLNGRALFYHLSKMTGPVGSTVSKSIKSNFSRSINKTRDLGKQLFINSNPPKDPIIKDKIKRKQAAIKKRRLHIRKQKDRMLQENMTNQEIKELDQVIEQNQ